MGSLQVRRKRRPGRAGDSLDHWENHGKSELFGHIGHAGCFHALIMG